MGAWWVGEQQLDLQRYSMGRNCSWGFSRMPGEGSSSNNKQQALHYSTMSWQDQQCLLRPAPGQAQQHGWAGQPQAGPAPQQARTIITHDLGTHSSGKGGCREGGAREGGGGQRHARTTHVSAAHAHAECGSSACPPALTHPDPP